MQPNLRVGYGYDVHRLVPADKRRGLMVGGVRVSRSVQALAHSDGDVLLHALCDALLGAAGLGDIGEHFPDTDAQWKDADSGELLGRCRELLAECGWTIINADCTVQLEHILLGEFKPRIRQNVARLLALDPTCVNIKATRGEGADAVGRGETIIARAVCLLGGAPGN